ncbi:FecR domain-containing protein [Aurantibacter crassamenti]|uniref:FecR family protein n=1 Tax=Aurantibacter crassamenti TaxID=1837375 RepID=UPI00193A195E|nr:FecR domain-containing protein [Aurantibacter crassamenti]MBM1105463.1 FecR domain-containing protein [Aurantibacter crassamenti]
MKENITKLILGTISEKELLELHNWLNKPNNQSQLESYIRIYYDLNLTTLKNDEEKAYSKVLNEIDLQQKPKKKLIPNWLKYAATIALIIGFGYILRNGLFFEKSSNKIVPKNDAITLELDNGSIKKIDISKSTKVKDSNGRLIVEQNKNRLKYSKTTTGKSSLVYNKIHIPYGKKLEIELSDGTQVYLNSGSSLRYPVDFSSFPNRLVQLSGEGYFKVAKNSSRPFIVKCDSLNVKVLGTEFNVSAYDNESNIDVVLVEGSVNLNNGNLSSGKSVNLKPGEKGSYSQAKNIAVEMVNTEIYTSWIDGYLIFRNLTFDEITERLERHYNVEIENANAELGKEIFNASFHNVEIEKVLSFFNDTHAIAYVIENNKVLIK